MNNDNGHEQEQQLSVQSLKVIIKKLMMSNVDNARSIYALSTMCGMLDSQEFINWQDELNEISVKY